MKITVPQYPTTHALRNYFLLASVYILLLFILPPNSHTLHAYNLSTVQYHFLLLLISLPSLLVWLTAFIGYSKLWQYAQAVSDTPEGVHYAQLARGCAWLAWSLPLTTIMPFWLHGLANTWTSFHPAAIIISNYLNLLMPLVAFSIIAGAARGLMTSDPHAQFDQESARLIVIGFLTAGVLYCFLTFRRFDLSSLTTTNNPYFLPIWLLIITVTIPYLYAWFTGLLATYELALFTKKTRGVLYQRALRFVIGGLIAVIVSSIALQYINSILPAKGYLVIDYRLLLNSLFWIIGGAGFILLAVGAIRLKKIEDV